MNKIIVFDIDGVLFPNQGPVHKYILDRYYPKIECLRWVIHQNMKIPRHFYDEDNKYGKEYIERFNKRYSSLIMPKRHVERLKKIAKDHILYIVSYNHSNQVQELLHASGIFSLFREVIISDISPGNKIKEFSKIAQDNGCHTSELSFITDTVSDIKEAQKAGIKDIYAVVADKDPKEYLIEYVSEKKIIPGFY